MFNAIALVFLLLVAYQDEIDGLITWAVLIPFFLIAFWFRSPQSWWQMVIVYLCCYGIANVFNNNGREFGGGDAKALTVLSGLVGLTLTASTLVLAMIVWRATKYPNKVRFGSYILLGYLLSEFVVSNYHGLILGIR